MPASLASSFNAAASGAAPAPFGQIVRIGPIGADRVGDRVVVDQRHRGDSLADDVQRFLVGNARGHAVGARVGAVGGHHSPGRDRQA